MTNGPKHKYLRALVANPLSLENLKTYVPLIEKAVLALLDLWQDNTVLGAHQEMRRVRAMMVTERVTERVTGYREPNILSGCCFLICGSAQRSELMHSDLCST